MIDLMKPRQFAFWLWDPRDLACLGEASERSRASRVNEFGGESRPFPPNSRSCRARRQGAGAKIRIVDEALTPVVFLMDNVLNVRTGDYYETF